MITCFPEKNRLRSKIYSFLSISLLIMLIFSSCKNINSDKEQPLNDGHKLIIDMVEEIGGKELLYSLKDVEYTYIKTPFEV